MGTRISEWIDRLPPELALPAAAAGALVAALVAHGVVLLVLGRIARHSSWVVDDAFERHCRQPLRAVLVFVSLRAVLAAMVERVPAGLAALGTVALILSLGWLVARLIRVLEDSLLARLDLEASDNLRARSLHTQVRFLRRIGVVAVAVLTGGCILLSFDALRQLGAGLLTSAGIAGVVIGFAAQRTMGNLISGFQVVFTQPIRTDDVVIVEGEWGRIEEITLTYVVVRIWDERRLIVPIGYFLEKPFQNWTRVSADLLGSVHLHVDYRVSVDDLRETLRKLLESSAHWDGKVARVHVTEAREHTLEVRALMSAADSAAAWELRCEVREGLIRHLQEHHPEALPRLRAEPVGAAAGEA